jgi:hypothetical protein
MSLIVTKAKIHHFWWNMIYSDNNCKLITDRIQIAQSLKVTLRSVCKCLQCEVLRFNMHDCVYYDYKQAQKWHVKKEDVVRVLSH